jgi:hypothetical protein
LISKIFKVWYSGKTGKEKGKRAAALGRPLREYCSLLGRAATLPPSPGLKAAVEVELRCVLAADQIVGRLPQLEDLPFGEPLQVGEHRYGLLPVVADPGQRIDGQVESIAAEVAQQALRRSAGKRGIDSQFRPVAADAGGVRRSESGP